MKFDVLNRFTSAIQFTAEIECDENTTTSVKLGLAVQWAFKARANLDGANLAGANLDGAYLAGAKDADRVIAQTRILPEGSIIGWKKCRDQVLVKLRIPEESRRCHAFGRKCRAEYVDVLEVIGADIGVSQYDGKTTYRVGQRVHCDQFDENWRNECSGGIHFFITQVEAMNW